MNTLEVKHETQDLVKYLVDHLEARVILRTEALDYYSRGMVPVMVEDNGLFDRTFLPEDRYEVLSLLERESRSLCHCVWAVLQREVARAVSVPSYVRIV